MLQYSCWCEHISELLLLLSQFCLQLLLKLLSLFYELLCKYTLKGLKSSLFDISWLLNWLSGLLVDSRRRTYRGNTYSSSCARLNSLRNLWLLRLFFDRLLNSRSKNLRWSLLCCAMRVILISHCRLVWLGRHGLLLLLLLCYGGLISRRGSSKVNRLVDVVAYCSFIYFTTSIFPFARLPIL